MKAAKGAAEQQQIANEQAARDDIMEKARLAEQESLRVASLRRIEEAVQKLQWPKNGGKELSKAAREKLLNAHCFVSQ